MSKFISGLNKCLFSAMDLIFLLNCTMPAGEGKKEQTVTFQPIEYESLPV